MTLRIVLLTRCFRFIYQPKRLFVFLLCIVAVSFLILWPEEQRTRSSAAHSDFSVYFGVANETVADPKIISFPKKSVCSTKSSPSGRFKALLDVAPNWEEEPDTPEPSRWLLFILTHLVEFESRGLIRSTWGNGGWQSGSAVKILHVVWRSSHEDAGRLNLLKEEKNLFDDVIEVIFDHSTRFPHGIPVILNWIKGSCAKDTRSPSTIAFVREPSKVFIVRDRLFQSIQNHPDGIYGVPITQLLADGKELDSLDGSLVILQGSSAVTAVLQRPFPLMDETLFISRMTAEFGIQQYLIEPFVTKHSGQRSGCWVEKQFVITDVTPEDLIILWSAFTDPNLKSSIFCGSPINVHTGLFIIAMTVLLISLSVVNTDFWSSLSSFCSELCDAVDSGDDSDFESLPGTPPALDQIQIPETRQVLQEFLRSPDSTLVDSRF